MRYKYIFGPVPSRRLGTSLGVDLVPKKVCSLDCVYCESGRTTKLTTERREYIPYSYICNELESYFSENTDPDYITLSGSGEPTLNSGMGKIIDFIRLLRPEVPVAVLTNGTLLYDSGVREELLNAHLVIPSLDATDNAVFDRINRPAEGLDIQKIIDGLEQFRKEFSGEIWLEIFILPEYNDEPKVINGFRNLINRIMPDRIQINTLDRPGVLKNIRPASKEELISIRERWKLDNLEIISTALNQSDNIISTDDLEDRVLSTIKRRPCTLEDLKMITGLQLDELKKYTSKLERAGKIEKKKQNRGFFYRALSA